jgi:hypothetical protein
MNRNEYYQICHYCVEYKTTNPSDMIRHFKRKNKCKCKTIFSYEDSIELSKKKYKFNFDIHELAMNDLIFIITHYNEDINIIDKKFRNPNILDQEINQLIDKYTSNDSQNSSNNMFDLLNKSTSYNNVLSNMIQFLDNRSKDNSHTSSPIKNSSDSDTMIPVNINSYISDDMYDDVCINTSTNEYLCKKCNKTYSNIDSIRKHLINKTCIKRQNRNNIMKKNKEVIDMIIQKEKENQEITNQQINYNNCNFQNINNQHNNTHHNTYHVNMRDFTHDRYDISHIKDNFYLRKDFFLYHNFLHMIMQNKKNQNIFFSGNEAVVYTDNELNRISSDKAGYLLLDKLSQSLDQLIGSQTDEVKTYFHFIASYYRMIKGKYKHDTIFNDYDIDDHKFYYTSNSGSFRFRDKYLAKMISTLSAFKEGARENMRFSIQEMNDIPLVNPNIEDFASVKLRYRDLKD